MKQNPDTRYKRIIVLPSIACLIFLIVPLSLGHEKALAGLAVSPLSLLDIPGLENYDKKSQEEVSVFLKPEINESDKGKVYQLINNSKFGSDLWKNFTLSSIGLNVQVPNSWNASLKGNELVVFSGILENDPFLRTPIVSGGVFQYLEPFIESLMEEEIENEGRFLITISNKGLPLVNNTKVLANILLKQCMDRDGCNPIEPTTSKYIIDGERSSSFKTWGYKIEVEVIEVIHNGQQYEIISKYGNSKLSLDTDGTDDIEQQEDKREFDLLKNYILHSIKWLS